VIGRSLAHYRITAALGAGGMGEVWRATDSKPGREVALDRVIRRCLERRPKERFQSAPDFAFDLESLATGSGAPCGTAEPPMRVSLVDVADGGRHPWRDLAPRDTAGVFSIDYLAVNPGGEGYVYSYRRLLSTLQVIEGLQ